MAVSKKLLSLCLAFLMVFSLTAMFAVPQANAAAAESDEASWTILVYMCGSDLESDGGYASDDMEQMMDSPYSDQVNVVIETGGASEWESNVSADEIGRYARRDGGLYLVDSQPAADMGEEKTLESFLTWGVENYPAEHIGLIFWNHGGGSISGVCFDENNDYNSLSLNDIGTALKKATADCGKFEFVGFDACLMATLETANMLAPYANYMYASEETEPGTGWDYDTFLGYLAENPDADGKDLGKVQCESYFDYCEEMEGEDPSITFSIIDLSKIDALVTAFDKTAKELSEAKDYAPIARGIFKADNFGGNSRAEGYTNMVDLADMLGAVSDYAPSAKQTLKALTDAVIYSSNGAMHENAGGLALYYPLHIEGSQEISIFRDICPSTYYYALVAGLAKNADLTASAEEEEGAGLAAVEDSDTIEVEDVYLTENGIYTVELSSMDEFAYGTCSVYMDDGDGGLIYIGEDDDVVVDYDACTIQDNFDGTWLWLDGLHLVPIEWVSRSDTMSLYVASVLLNGVATNLQIAYDWDTGKYEILGTWDGVDSETGMAARSAEPLEKGDILNFVYSYCDEDGEWSTFTGDDIEVTSKMELYYDTLTEGDYYYAINLYDIYGNGYQLDYADFYVEADGSVSFYTD